MTDGDRPLNNDWVLGPEPLELPATNGERFRGFQGSKKGKMTKQEVRVMLKALFNITDEDSIDIVWDEMEQIRKKKEGE